MSNVVTIGDMHCGHLVGLTPPDWQVKNSARSEAREVQKMLWREFTKLARPLRGMEVLIVNGDAIDGRGDASGGTELITTSLIEQGEMATAVIEWLKPKKVFMSYGTPYHTGKAGEDFEDLIAAAVKAESIKSHGFLDYRGILFDYKHHLGGSSTPYGCATPLLKDQLWSDLWARNDEGRLADVVVRSHQHTHIGVTADDRWSIVLPALQGPGSKFGTRKCSKVVHFGFCSFQIEKKGEYSWQKHGARVTSRNEEIQYVK